MPFESSNTPKHIYQDPDHNPNFGKFLEVSRKIDYYELFEIDNDWSTPAKKTANLNKINKLYRDLILVYHLDKANHSSGEEQYKILQEHANICAKFINHARDTLTNDILRREYDTSCQTNSSQKAKAHKTNSRYYYDSEPHEKNFKTAYHWEPKDDGKAYGDGFSAVNVSKRVQEINDSLDTAFEEYKTAFEKARLDKYLVVAKSAYEHFKAINPDCDKILRDGHNIYHKTASLTQEKQRAEITSNFKSESFKASLLAVIGYTFYPLGGFNLVKRAEKIKQNAEDKKEEGLRNIGNPVDFEAWKNSQKDTNSKFRHYAQDFKTLEDFIKYNESLPTEQLPLKEWEIAKGFKHETKQEIIKIEEKLEEAQLRNIKAANAIQSPTTVKMYGFKNLTDAAESIVTDFCKISGQYDKAQQDSEKSSNVSSVQTSVIIRDSDPSIPTSTR